MQPQDPESQQECVKSHFINFLAIARKRKSRRRCIAWKTYSPGGPKLNPPSQSA